MRSRESLKLPTPWALVLFLFMRLTNKRRSFIRF